MRTSIWLILALTWPALAAANEVIGTVDVSIDGEPTTWYLLQPPGDVPPTALWVAMGPDRGMTSLAAYADPELEFVQDADTGATVPSGDAAVLLLSFAFPLEADSLRVDLPAEGATGPATIVLMENWRNLLDQQNAAEGPGEIHATVIEAEQNGKSRFSGTFHGTLRGGGVSTELTEGKFSVDGARLHPQPGARAR